MFKKQFEKCDALTRAFLQRQPCFDWGCFQCPNARMIFIAVFLRQSTLDLDDEILQKLRGENE